MVYHVLVAKCLFIAIVESVKILQREQEVTQFKSVDPFLYRYRFCRLKFCVLLWTLAGLSWAYCSPQNTL